MCFGTQTSMKPKRGKADFIVPAPAVVALRIQHRSVTPQNTSHDGCFCRLYRSVVCGFNLLIDSFRIADPYINQRRIAVSPKRGGTSAEID